MADGGGGSSDGGGRRRYGELPRRLRCARRALGCGEADGGGGAGRVGLGWPGEAAGGGGAQARSGEQSGRPGGAIRVGVGGKWKRGAWVFKGGSQGARWGSWGSGATWGRGGRAVTASVAGGWGRP
nr:glycine-rich cell wall structural protein 1.0-like [Lolium perenne]